MQITRDAGLNPTNDNEICRLKRHALGIYQIYISMGVAYAVILGLLVYGIPQSHIKFSTAQLGLLWLGFAFAGLVTMTFLLIARHIYWGSELCVTDTAVSQVVQLGLFNRKVSRLDMEKVEDVTSAQRGIFQSMFNYGTLTVETAGEQENFVFPYCPNPNKVAQDIHAARQHYLERHMGQPIEMHAQPPVPVATPPQNPEAPPQYPAADQQPAAPVPAEPTQPASQYPKPTQQAPIPPYPPLEPLPTPPRSGSEEQILPAPENSQQDQPPTDPYRTN